MKRDFSIVLVGLDGASFVDVKGEPLTLGVLSSHVLGVKYQGEENLSGDEQYKRFLLSERVYQGGSQEVSAEDVALLKHLIAKACEPRLLGPAYRSLEQDPAEAPVTV
jgi:hypothetical protein